MDQSSNVLCNNNYKHSLTNPPGLQQLYPKTSFPSWLVPSSSSLCSQLPPSRSQECRISPTYVPNINHSSSPQDLGNAFVANNAAFTAYNAQFLSNPFFGYYQNKLNIPPQLPSQTNNNTTSQEFFRGIGANLYRNITIEELRPYFNKPIILVAKDFNICITLMKKICRRAGIKRWPHRRIRSIVNTISQQQVLLSRSFSPVGQHMLIEKINILKEQLAMIIADPDVRFKKTSWSSSQSEELEDKNDNVKIEKRNGQILTQSLIIPRTNLSSNQMSVVRPEVQLAPIRYIPNTSQSSSSREELLKQDKGVYDQISKKIRQAKPSIHGAMDILQFSQDSPLQQKELNPNTDRKTIDEMLNKKTTESTSTTQNKTRLSIAAILAN